MEVHAKDIKLVPLSEIKLNPKNRNKHPASQIDHISRIIKKTGFRRPGTISNRTGLLVCGEGRYHALKKLGAKEMPVMFQDYADEAQEMADGVADNALDKQAELDNAGILQDVLDLGPDFDFDLLGIPDFKLPEDFEPQCDEDAVPEHVEPRTKLGDLYQLGEHRLLCGDSTNVLDLEKLLNRAHIDLVFTDPPYGINYQDVKKNHKKIENDSNLDAIQSILAQLLAFNVPTFICCNWKCYSTFEKAMQEADRSPKACIVWDKGSRVQNLDKFGKQHEFILYHGPFGGEKTIDVDVWQCKRQVLSEHPTAKPIELIERALSHFPKGNILDLFGGSGSTLIACEKTKRKCFMSELDPHYVSVIIERWMKYSGKIAYLIEDSSGKLKEPVAYADLDSFRGESMLDESKGTAQKNAGR